MTALLLLAFVCLFFGCVGVAALYLHVSQVADDPVVLANLVQIEPVATPRADQTARLWPCEGVRELVPQARTVRPVQPVVTDRHLWVNKPTHAKKRNDQSRLSRQVREAAHWTCQQCGVVLRGGYSYLLHMHHIDGDHTNNKEENLMALCVECHSQKDGLGHRLLGEEIACDGRLKRLHRLRRAQRGGA